VALGEALSVSGGLWFGWSGAVNERGAGEGKLHIQRAGNVTLATVDLSHDDHAAYYRGYANGVLWPVFHYRLDLADFDAGYIEGYRRVNRLFAHKLMAMLKPDDVIWVHDYHLIPMAAELRAMGCRQRIGFFLHTPLPPPLILAAIPGHEWLMRALFAYDLVGLQSQADMNHLSRYLITEAGAEQLGDGVFGAFNRSLRAAAFRSASTSMVSSNSRAARTRWKPSTSCASNTRTGNCWSVSIASTIRRACRSASAPSAPCSSVIPRTA
jgi:trehalose 6-phosphate synthase